MGNDLRQRLEALSASATPGPWFVTELPWFNSADGIVAGSPDGNICAPVADFENMGAGYEYHHQGSTFSIGDKYDARADTQFVVELINAWRDGTIVTRSEMESREAILVKALRFIDDTISWEINTGNYDHSDVCQMDRSWCEIGDVAEKALDSVADHPLEQQTFTRSEMEEAVAKAVAEMQEIMRHCPDKATRLKASKALEKNDG